MTNTSDFSLAVVANACAGAAALRERLAAHGLDTTTVAGIVRTSPLTIARATKSGSTPRGVLVGLALLVTVMERLAAHGVGAADVRTGADTAKAAIDAVAAESALAAEMIMRLREAPTARSTSVQLALDPSGRIAA